MQLVGPAGEVELAEGVIVAKRHLHISAAEAEKANVANGEVIMVKITSADRSLIFDDVEVRIGEGCDATMHVDTDESNCCWLHFFNCWRTHQKIILSFL